MTAYAPRYPVPASPEDGLPRLFSDGSHHAWLGSSFGACIVDSAGAELACVYGRCRSDQRQGSALAEWSGLVEGLRLTADFGLPRVAVFTDLSDIRRTFNGPPRKQAARLRFR